MGEVRGRGRAGEKQLHKKQPGLERIRTFFSSFDSFLLSIPSREKLTVGEGSR